MRGRRRFAAVIRRAGVNPYVDVPAADSGALSVFAERGRVRVAVTIDGHPFSASLTPVRGGRHRLYVHGGMRAAAGVDVGERIRVELRPLATGEIALPPDLARRLGAARLRRRFDALPASRRRELLRAVEAARSAANRSARIDATLAHLRGETTQRPRPAVVDRPLWICPRCGHPFVTRNMNHSCARHRLEDVFRGRPAEVRALFDRFRAMVGEHGPVREIVYRDRVAFMVKVRFCGASPRRDHIEVGFWFTERDDHPRFSRVETITTSAHVHRLKIRRLDELDGDVRRWIDRSYRVGRRERLVG